MKRWQIILVVLSIIWIVFLKLFCVITRSPTITWIITHYATQSAALVLAGLLVGWIVFADRDSYPKKSDGENKPIE